LFLEDRNISVDFRVDEAAQYFTESVTTPPTNTDYQSYNKSIVLTDLETNIYSINVYSKSYNKANATIILKKDFLNENTNTQKLETVAKKTICISNKGGYINTFIDVSNVQNVVLNMYIYGKDLDIEKIVINECNFKFNIIRAIIIYLFLIVAYKIKNKSIYRLKYNKDSKKQNLVFKIIAAIVLGLLFAFCVLEHFCYPEKLEVDPNNTKESMIMQAEAFRNGSIALLNEPDEILEGLENPYDISSRYYSNCDYVFDTAYYNGKFYQYFSALPVIFFILPFRLITGYYITTKVFNTFLFIILLFVLTILYKKLIDMFIKDISFFNFILGYLTLIFGSDVINYARGLMYDIPVVFGLISLILAILILLNLLNNKEKLKYLKLILVGIFTGFIVMSKPSLIAYYIIIFSLLLSYLKKDLISKNIKTLIKKIFAFIIPLSLMGIIQMWFNYVRFDSIFEFGALYQLTVADMRVHTGISLPILMKGIMKFLFTLPSISLFEFPFINTYDTMYYSMGLNEYEYENSVAGILIIPIIWLIFLKGKIKKEDKIDKKLVKIINIVLITSVTLIVIVTCYAGAAEAYSMDVKIMLVLFSLLIGFKLLEQSSKNNISFEKYNFIFLVLCAISIFLVMPQSISTEGSLLENMYMPINIYLSHFFEFWL
jgi:uncharacterized integral membrane protein